ncbi:hypothetical protein VP01_5079g2 [Puccinia sorghi]|uniref:GAG-pre-integrase domain-containing protein n=1 Tax=Puccinia sorghi TaxID=27349 RepID=A0A0L6ULE5_9BASI|nr:hypothetical protein VP01_5079g2 [Puccinia sorghi]
MLHRLCNPKPVTEFPNNFWKQGTFLKDEQKLLHLHQLFGHASLRHIFQLVPNNLGHGLPSVIPSGDIHCPVCAISKRTKFNNLSSTCRPAHQLDIIAVELIGPFRVNLVDGRQYLLTMRDIGFCFAKTLKRKDEAN